MDCETSDASQNWSLCLDGSGRDVCLLLPHYTVFKLTVASACVCSILKTTLGLTALGNGEDLTCKLESTSYLASARFKTLIISKITLRVWSSGTKPRNGPLLLSVVYHQSGLFLSHYSTKSQTLPNQDRAKRTEMAGRQSCTPSRRALRLPHACVICRQHFLAQRKARKIYSPWKMVRL